METSPWSANLKAEAVPQERFFHATKVISRAWQWRIFTAGLVVCDLMMIGLAFRIAYLIRFELAQQFFQPAKVHSLSYYQTFALGIIPIWIIIFGLIGLYNRHNLLGGTQEYSLAFNATTVGMLILMASGFLYPTLVFARGWLITAWFFALLFMITGRFVYRRIAYWLRRRGYLVSLAVIIGANNEGISLAEQLNHWGTSGLHVIGFVDKKLPAGKAVYANMKVLGPVEDLRNIINRNQVEELILASSAISSRDAMVEIFMQYGFNSGVNVRMSSGLYELITTGLSVKEFAFVPLVGIDPVRMRGVDQFLKGLLDYALTIPGTILLAPFLAVIAILIKLDSPGPVIHRRRVMGVNCRQFDAFKFRTMYANGDDILETYPDLKKELAENHKLKNDPRITRIGHFLRRTSLDELPQIFNVLRREMSLVGPRMISPAETEKYDKWERNLLTVKPGISGLWQVNGRSDVSYEERVRMDMYYIRNWSIWLDLHILIQTPSAVLKERGAY